MNFTKNQLEPTVDLSIKVLQGLTSVPGSESFIPRQSLFNEKLVLKFLLNNLEERQRFELMQD
jgi:hypothetical protein